MPERGTPLKHEDLTLLDLRIDEGWNGEKVAASCLALAERIARADMGGGEAATAVGHPISSWALLQQVGAVYRDHGLGRNSSRRIAWPRG